MRAQARFHRAADAALLRFARLQDELYPGAADHLPVLFDNILRTLEKTNGFPPGSFEHPGWDPPMRWWEITRGWWINYTIRKKKPWRLFRLFQPALLKITVLDLTDENPS